MPPFETKCFLCKGSGELPPSEWAQAGHVPEEVRINMAILNLRSVYATIRPDNQKEMQDRILSIALLLFADGDQALLEKLRPRFAAFYKGLLKIGLVRDTWEKFEDP